ncbi:MAG TPA: glycosyltransferase family 2 protein [Pirellulales bacterium]|jgi:dolichol-phosphate mannosyltransferase|nr:glycosyltransferase family 2 protein [Pirellulales bacterium]
MLTTVIPVYNEAESLVALHGELAAVAAEHGYALDIIFVDDGSTDRSWETIARLAAKDARVRGIRFRRNFGKAAALSAGFRAAQGDLVMTLDADLQDDPREIPRFLAELTKPLDVVSGWKKIRHDPWHKVFPSRVFNWMVSRLTGVRLHDHNCGMKCYRRQVVREVRLYGELHRFIPVLANARGFKVGELAIAHRARQFGHSKYGFRRFFKGFLDLLTVKFLTGFGQRPSHLLGAMGLGSFALGMLGLFYLAVYWLVYTLRGIDPVLHNRPALLYSLGALLLGGQLLSISFLAELITAYSSRESDSYAIAEETAPAAVAASHRPALSAESTDDSES